MVFAVVRVRIDTPQCLLPARGGHTHSNRVRLPEQNKSTIRVRRFGEGLRVWFGDVVWTVRIIQHGCTNVTIE